MIYNSIHIIWIFLTFKQTYTKEGWKHNLPSFGIKRVYLYLLRNVIGKHTNYPKWTHETNQNEHTKLAKMKTRNIHTH